MCGELIINIILEGCIFSEQRFEIEREQMYMEEEDEDCDSEFDDFIDDEELGEDVRAEVRKITGYDPRR